MALKRLLSIILEMGRKKYYLTHMLYLGVVVLGAFIVCKVCLHVSIGGVLRIQIRGIIYLVLINILYYSVYWCIENYRRAIALIKDGLKKKTRMFLRGILNEDRRTEFIHYV